jgi:dipeptidase
MKLGKIILITSIIVCLVTILGLVAYTNPDPDFFDLDELGCHDFAAGKDATVDGSVLSAQTVDGPYDSRLIIIPAADHKPGEMSPVYKGIIRAYPEFPNVKKNYFRGPYEPLKKLGEIAEVPHTYKVFKHGYPNANENQVLMGENTLGNQTEFSANLDKAIMYIEQLQLFGLQRSKTARECIKVMGELAEKYGYADVGESLMVSDPNEVFVFEIYPVGPFWTPESGKPGAVWCAQRVPDDHVTAVPNYSRIQEIDPNDKENFICSSNYMSCAIEAGVYDPASGEPFIWNFTYCDTRGKENPRLWRAYNVLAPSGKWQYTEVAHYPFSIKPDKKVSFRTFIELYQDVLVGSGYDPTEDPAWYVRPRSGEFKGQSVKSTYASTKPDAGMQALLNIYPRSTISGYGCSYYYVNQARSWLPNEIGGVFWFGLDNPKTGVYIPVYTGINRVPESWSHLDRTKFDRNSAWWAFAAVDDQLDDRWGYLKPMLEEVIVPIQEEMYNNQESIEQEALKLYKSDPESAKKFLTDYTCSLMEKTEKTYWDLWERFLYEMNNNMLSLPY